MTPTLQEILKQNIVDDQDVAWHTHVSMVQPRGKFQFSRNNLEIFWNIYSSSINSEQIPIIGIAEKPQNHTPVLVDIDLKLEENEENEYEDHLYSTNHVDKIVKIYQL